MTDAPAEERASEEGPASCTFHSAGLSACVLSAGAALHELFVHDSRGSSADVLLGFDSANDYLKNPAYIGVVVGRVANRIGGSKFSLDGREFRVSQNDGTHCLHGGSAGLSKAIWKSKPIPDGVTLTINSPDGDQGFPGAVEASVTYLLRGQELEISYRATTTHSTPLSLTSHVYFNLAGQGNIYDHEVSIAADNYIPVDDTSIPTGEIASVEGTLFDLRKPVRLGHRLANLPGGGFDHNFCFISTGSHQSSNINFHAHVLSSLPRHHPWDFHASLQMGTAFLETMRPCVVMANVNGNLSGNDRVANRNGNENEIETESGIEIESWCASGGGNETESGVDYENAASNLTCSDGQRTLNETCSYDHRNETETYKQKSCYNNGKRNCTFNRHHWHMSQE